VTSFPQQLTVMNSEFPGSLVADLAALRVVDDVTDDGQRGFEHGLNFLSHVSQVALLLAAH
jgi:hypothetical protein